MNVSIIIATYNGEKYLFEQLFSIYEQSYQVNEVIIVDDCSSDNTVNIIKQFIKEHNLINWKLYENEKNIGFIDNFKKGLSLSNGDILFLCDQDDIWNRDKVYLMIDKMKSDNILSLSCGFSIIDDKNKEIIIEERKGKSNNNLLDYKLMEKEVFNVPLRFLLKKNFAQGCCTAIKKEIAIKYLKSNDNNIHLEHDWSLLILSAIENKCYFYNEKLVKYRIHNSNLIGLNEIDNGEISNSIKRLENRIDIICGENQRIKYVLQNSAINDNIQLIMRKNENYNLERIKNIKEKRIFGLINNYYKYENKNYRSFRALIGDILYLRNYNS